jgi:hypothetical protein
MTEQQYHNIIFLVAAWGVINYVAALVVGFLIIKRTGCPNTETSEAKYQAIIAMRNSDNAALEKALRELVDYGGTTDRWDDARRYAKQVLASVGNAGSGS